VLLHARTRQSGCKPADLPDGRCSPGAYSSELPAAVICSPNFHTSSIRHVPEAVKHAVERAYGLTPRAYGRSLEIDHIVSLELGGSNDPANLFPERAPGYHAKDKLENNLHNLVCSGAMTLRVAQRRIAQNWITLYRDLFGTPPLRRLATQPTASPRNTALTGAVAELQQVTGQGAAGFANAARRRERNGVRFDIAVTHPLAARLPDRRLNRSDDLLAALLETEFAHRL
jgi:hypothetical protein